MSLGRTALPLLALTLAAAAPPVSRDAAFRHFLQAEFAEMQADNPDISYAVGWADLDHDGRDEALVHVRGRGLCGSAGCALYLYTPRGRSWRALGEIAPIHGRVLLLRGRRHGWSDLGVHIGGGGIVPGADVRVRFNGRDYGVNPSVGAAAVPPGAVVRTILSDAEIRDGRPLFH